MRIAVISDTHFCPPETPDSHFLHHMYLSKSKDIGLRLAKELKRQQPDFIIHCGDFANGGTAEDWDWGQRLLDETGIPWYAVRGNHDQTEAALTRMTARFGAPYYAVQLGSWRGIFADVGTPTRAEKPCHEAGEAQLAFLRKEMAEPGPKLAVCHFPYFTGLHPNFPGEIGGWQRPEELAEVLGGARITLFGHWHSWGQQEGRWHIPAACEAPHQFLMLTLGESEPEKAEMIAIPGCEDLPPEP